MADNQVTSGPTHHVSLEVRWTPEIAGSIEKILTSLSEDQKMALATQVIREYLTSAKTEREVQVLQAQQLKKFKESSEFPRSNYTGRPFTDAEILEHSNFKWFVDRLPMEERAGVLDIYLLRIREEMLKMLKETIPAQVAASPAFENIKSEVMDSFHAEIGKAMTSYLSSVMAQFIQAVFSNCFSIGQLSNALNLAVTESMRQRQGDGG